MIFMIIVVGGLTRLTNSGLSITQWELFKGILPPLNDHMWNQYFSLYKKIPQYQLINNNMTLDEFKIIFYWEYFHRILGRLIGLFFLLPFFYFYFKRKINKKYISICFLVLLLIMLQGFFGWYMVKSGLTNNVSVSHYRLSLHLGLAFIIISIIFWTLLNFNKNNIKNFFINEKKNYIFYLLIILIFLQIILGALVSGLDAGKIYQTWPLMNESYFPGDINFRNYREFLNLNDRSVVQFIHRNIAYLIFFVFVFIGIEITKSKEKKLYKSYFYLLILILIQIILGILALISNLNIALASLHQISSIFLIIISLNFYFKSIN